LLPGFNRPGRSLISRARIDRGFGGPFICVVLPIVDLPNGLLGGTRNVSTGGEVCASTDGVARKPASEDRFAAQTGSPRW